MSWFQRHLNWTWLFAYLIWIPLNYPDDAFPPIIGAIFLLVVSGWVIKQKGRSLWWILLTPIFSPLWLKSMSQAIQSLPTESLVYDGIALLLLKQTQDASRDSSQTLKKQLDAAGQSKLPKVEAELFYFNVFALDYWIQMSPTYSLEKQRLIRGAFNTHLANIINMDTLQQRLIEYGRIVSEAKGDNAKFIGFGMKLSEFCDMPSVFFLVIAPNLFTQALETISIVEKGIPKP